MWRSHSLLSATFADVVCADRSCGRGVARPWRFSVGLAFCNGRRGSIAHHADVLRAADFDVQAGHMNRRFCLNLECAIEMPTQDRALQDAAQRFWTLTHEWHPDSLYWDLGFLQILPDMPHDYRELLSTVPIWQGEPVTHVHVFIDGSSFLLNRHEHSIDHAAWAFIVILQCQGGNGCCFRFYCAKSQALARANVDRTQCVDVGEVLPDALSAEAVGMIWTFAWIAQQPFSCPTTVHYDNVTIGGFASGHSQWNATWEYLKLKDNLAAMKYFLQVIGKSFQCAHLKSHAGYPWSEAVDSLAKATAKGIMPSLRHLPCISAALRTRYAAYAWMDFWDSGLVPKPSALRATFAAEGPFLTFLRTSRGGMRHLDRRQSVNKGRLCLSRK